MRNGNSGAFFKKGPVSSLSFGSERRNEDGGGSSADFRCSYRRSQIALCLGGNRFSRKDILSSLFKARHSLGAVASFVHKAVLGKRFNGGVFRYTRKIRCRQLRLSLCFRYNGKLGHPRLRRCGIFFVRRSQKEPLYLSLCVCGNAILYILFVFYLPIAV